MSVKKYYYFGKNQLYPICRSITGQGVKKTLKLIQKEFNFLKIKKVKSGTKAYDWVIPSEWNIKDAFFLDKNNKKFASFKKNNLHIVGYSEPVNKYVKKNELIKHLHSYPLQPNAIPYITSYYKKNWGFCVNNNDKKKIINEYSAQDKFKVLIKSNLNKNGFLHYGELILKGKSKEEILISTNICHPSMANNELSGPIVSMSLINFFSKKKLNKTIRFLFLPETIGSIYYLSKNINSLKKNIIGGYNLSCIGDDRMHSCILSKYENTHSDKALISSYKKLGIKFKKFSFLKRGSDERQFNSPGIDLPIASISRTKFDEFPEYHTSMDNFKIVTLSGISGGFDVTKNAIEILQKKTIPISKYKCEPFMSKRKLYPHLSKKNNKKIPKYTMDFLQYADGKNDLEDISKLLNITFSQCNKICIKLKVKKLIN